MTRLMYDSTKPWAIPRDAEMVAFYVDGVYAWPEEWLALFPRATFVSISAIGVRTAQVGDVEVGCIWPPRNAVPWVRRARADGYDPTIYVNELNDWLAVRQAFWAAGEPEPHYWVARYNGVREIPPGAVARQFAHPHDGDGIADRPWETGAYYDLSIVADYWPGVDQQAPGGGGTRNPEDNDVTVYVRRVSDPTVKACTSSADGWWGREISEQELNILIEDARQNSRVFKVTVLEHDWDYDSIPARSGAAQQVWNYGVPTTPGENPPEYQPAHQVLANINTRVEDVVADVDEGALADALAARGIAGASPAQVKAALVEVLRSVSAPVEDDQQA